MPKDATAFDAIRPVVRSDEPHWLPLWRGYQTFYKVDIASDVTAEAWRRVLDPTEPVWAALAWQGERAIGLVHWIFHRSTWSVGNYCYLQDLFVDPAARGGGVGRQLITHVYRRGGTGGLPSRLLADT